MAYDPSEITFQQVRLAALAVSRPWGPFTQAQSEFLNANLRSSRKQPDSTDYRPLLRTLKPGETLDNVQTILDPQLHFEVI